MKATAPKVEHRDAQHYAGIRTQVHMSEFPQLIPRLVDELFGWLEQRGIEAQGAPIFRYYVLDMSGQMDVELGLVVANPVTGDGRVNPGVLPAGEYAFLVYTGVENGYAGNSALLDWGAKQGLNWDQWADPKGDAFAARYETFLMGPQDDPNPSNWDNEVAIKLA